MNIAIIFAGGTGSRMHSASIPKQFLELRKKPIIVYTLEVFDKHPEIDGIVVACLDAWIPYLQELLAKYRIKKVKKIVPGGATGQESIYNALVAAQEQYGDADNIVLVHDGVRPLIESKTISDNISMVKKKRGCVTTAPTTETFVIKQSDNRLFVATRAQSFIARAPQSFYLQDILSAHYKAQEESISTFIDSCTLMNHYGYSFGLVEGPIENIKITTDIDFCTFKAIIEEQIEHQD